MNVQTIRRLSALFCLVAAMNANPAKAQESPTDVIKEEIQTDGPFIELDPPGIIFEELYAGQKGEATVKIKNVGKAELLIDKVKASCGCTGVVVGEKRVPPGGASEIKVAFSASDRYVGRKTRKSVTIYSNDPRNNGTLRLELEANVKAGIIVEPDVVNLGQIVPGESQTVTLSLKAEDNHAFKITNATVENAEVESVEYPQGTAAQTHTVVAKFSPKSAARSGKSSIEIVTDHPKRGLISLPVYWRIQQPITIRPAYLALGRVDPGGVVERKLTIQSNLKEPLENIQFSVDGAPIKVTARQDAADKNSWTAAFSFPPDMAGQVVRAQLVVAPSNKNAPEIKVHLTAQVTDEINLVPEVGK